MCIFLLHVCIYFKDKFPLLCDVQLSFFLILLNNINPKYIKILNNFTENLQKKNANVHFHQLMLCEY